MTIETERLLFEVQLRNLVLKLEDNYSDKLGFDIVPNILEFYDKILLYIDEGNNARRMLRLSRKDTEEDLKLPRNLSVDLRDIEKMAAASAIREAKLRDSYNGLEHNPDEYDIEIEREILIDNYNTLKNDKTIIYKYLERETADTIRLLIDKTQPMQSRSIMAENLKQISYEYIKRDMHLNEASALRDRIIAYYYFEDKTNMRRLSIDETKKISSDMVALSDINHYKYKIAYTTLLVTTGTNMKNAEKEASRKYENIYEKLLKLHT